MGVGDFDKFIQYIIFQVLQKILDIPVMQIKGSTVQIDIVCQFTDCDILYRFGLHQLCKPVFEQCLCALYTSIFSL